MAIFVVAISKFDATNFTPFVLAEKEDYIGTLRGAYMILFAYMGYDYAINLSGECRNPAKQVPRSIIYTLLIATLFYCLVALAMAGMTKFHTFQPDIAIPLAFESVGLNGMTLLVYACGFLGLIACLFTDLLALPRVLFRFADDGLFFKIFKEINKKTKVPVKGGWISSIVICFMSFFLDL